MWMDEEDAHLEEQNSGELVDKFNSMLKDSSSVYFDVDQLEVIIDHYLELGKPESALKATNHGLSIFSSNQFLKLRKGQILISIGQFEEGKDMLLSLLEHDTTNDEILFGLGMAYAHEQMPNRAITFYKKAYDNADKELRTEILVELALQYQICEQPKKALACYERAFEINANTDVVLREFANYAVRTNSVLEATDIIKAHVDANPYSHKGWFHLGVLYAHLDLNDLAIDSFDFTIAIKENFAVAYFKKAECLIKQEKYEEALESLKEELKFRDPIAINYNIIADCYENLGDLEKAEEYYKKALGLDEYFSESYLGLGFIKELKFHYSEAVPFYEKAIEVDPENHNAYLMLSSVLMELDEVDRAEAVVKKLISVEEGLEEAWLELSKIQNISGDLEAALTTVEKGIESAFSNEQLWLKKVVYLHKIGQRKEAVRIARELLIENTNLKATLTTLSDELLNDSNFVNLLNEFQ